MFFSDLLILFLLSPSCFLIQPISSIPIVFSYSTYFIFARSSQSCFPIYRISSLLVHPNRVFLFILFLLCSSSQLYFLFLPISSMLFIPFILLSYTFLFLRTLFHTTYFVLSRPHSPMVFHPYYTFLFILFPLMFFHTNHVFHFILTFLCFFHTNYVFLFIQISSTLFHPNYTFLFILFLLCSFISIMFSFTFYFFYDSPPNRVFLVIFSALSS